MTTSPIPSNLVSVGIVKESAYGAGGTPVLAVPVVPPQAATNVRQQIDRSWRGSAVDSYSRIVSMLDGSLQLSGPVFPDGIGFPLAGLLGDVVFAAGSPNTWTIAVLNSGLQQPPTYAVTVNDPIGTLQYAGCKFSQLGLSFTPDGLLTWSANLQGMAPTTSAVTIPAASAEAVIAGWRGAVSIGGVGNATVLEASVQLSRAIYAQRNVAGQLAPYGQRSDPLAVSGTLNLVALTDSIRAAWAAGTATSLTINYSYGAGAAARQLQLQCSDVSWIQVDRDYSGKWVELHAAFAADANPTDAGASGGQSPLKVTLKNAVATGVYA